ncbi:uncharacterized protein LOC122512867 isoform X2 [Leptopilina heterotoma]|uniref:uncharacterized protein LOC122512867 isoform X2 n=1 Tax=Leptopilina heterotoma TaxID=63436 RepID=UPI001CA7BF5F|nr:uncharacterized protein LOC122512867 isoform X2 [Leptopilina heterotoma]
MHCMTCPRWLRKRNEDIYLLFAIVENNKNDFYAIRQEKNTLTLLKSNGNEKEFARIVANDSSLTMELEIFSRFFKLRNENYKVFIQKVADIKTKLFVNGLKNYYRDSTKAEKVIDFMKSLVPFYTCIENIKSGYQGGAAISCSLDALGLLPIAGVTAKYSSIMWRSLINEMADQSLFILAKSPINSLTLFIGFNQIYKTGFQIIMEEILTKHLLKDLTVASLQTLDPGFEQYFQFLRFSKNMVGKLVHTLSSKLINISKVEHLLESIKSAKNFIYKTETLVDQTGLIPSIIQEQNNFKIVKYHYTGGSNYFGPKCITSFGKTAELRTIEENLF